eukprot:CAMPEP_0182479762 /NCGR_PEP_ID=MMETSP1319-20130603/34729_1 /TAXON_ID=172717 /ORGANISM="Bolidomonas pacifica, Strain RCC208" /LENGTH=69 /DNA_ID=CAMNT_0024681201 /DNA_START=131 /DNA_END=336 /DNA_ORIENTATION=-
MIASAVPAWKVVESSGGWRMIRDPLPVPAASASDDSAELSSGSGSDSDSSLLDCAPSSLSSLAVGGLAP